MQTRMKQGCSEDQALFSNIKNLLQKIHVAILGIDPSSIPLAPVQELPLNHHEPTVFDESPHRNHLGTAAWIAKSMQSSLDQGSMQVPPRSSDVLSKDSCASVLGASKNSPLRSSTSNDEQTKAVGPRPLLQSIFIDPGSISCSFSFSRKTEHSSDFTESSISLMEMEFASLHHRRTTSIGPRPLKSIRNIDADLHSASMFIPMDNSPRKYDNVSAAAQSLYPIVGAKGNMAVKLVFGASTQPRGISVCTSIFRSSHSAIADCFFGSTQHAIESTWNVIHHVILSFTWDPGGLGHLDFHMSRCFKPFQLALLLLPLITYLNISGNKLTGMLFENVSCNSELEAVDLSSNLLTGSLPNCLVSDSNDRTVLYTRNCLEETNQDHHAQPFCHTEALVVGILPEIKKHKQAFGIGMAGISLPFSIGIGLSFVLHETITRAATVNDIVAWILLPPSCGNMPAQKVETGHQDTDHDVAMDYYGKRLATASSDHTIKIIGVSNTASQHLATLTGHQGPVWQVVWAHPKFGSLLSSCSYDGRVIVWKEGNQNEWTHAHVFDDHKASVNSVAWAPHELGLCLACGSSDGNMSIGIHAMYLLSPPCGYD